MKESYKTRHCSPCICENCGVEFLKPDSEITRNLKKGRKNFCSISCATQYRNKFQITPKVKEVRLNFAKNYSNFNSDNINEIDPELIKFKGLWHNLQNRSKSRNGRKTIPCNLTIEDLKNQWDKQQGICVYSGVKLVLPFKNSKSNKKILHTVQASVDRIDSNKPYEVGNIQFISVAMNYMKHTLSDLEVKRFLKEISSFTSTFVEDETISSSQNEMSDAQAGN